MNLCRGQLLLSDFVLLNGNVIYVMSHAYIITSVVLDNVQKRVYLFIDEMLTTRVFVCVLILVAFGKFRKHNH